MFRKIFSTAVVLTGSAFVLAAQSALVQEVTSPPQRTPTPTPLVVRPAAVGPVASPTPDPAAEREAYAVANALYSGGKFSEAVPALRQFLARYPNSAESTELYYKLGDSLRRTGQGDEAQKIFSDIFANKKNSPFSPFAAMRLAEQRMATEDMVGALPLLNAAIAGASTQGLRLNALYAKIIALQALDRVAETPDLLDQLTAVRENNPYLPFAELALGRYYESISDFETALRHYNRALAQSSSPDIRAEAGTRAGVAALRQGEAAEAIRLFDTTLRLDPPETWRRLSRLGLLRAQAAAGEHADFLRSWQAFNLNLPASLQPEFLYLRANAHRLVKPPDMEAATQAYTTVVRDFADSPFAEHAAYELILLQQSLNEPAEKLIVPLRNFLERYPRSTHLPTVRYLLARSMISEGRQAEALPLLMENLKIGLPKEAVPDMRLQAALALMATNKPAEALDLLLALLDEDPDSPLAEPALQLTALAQEATGDIDDSLATWDTLIARFPQSEHRPVALFRTGLMHARAARWPETRRALQALLSASPNFPQAREARFWRGLAAFHAGENQEAKKDLDFVVENAQEGDAYILPALQHLLMMAVQAEDLEAADPLARNYLHAAESAKDAPPLGADLLYWLASSREKLSQFTDADFWYEKLVPVAQDADLKSLALIGSAKSRLAIGRGSAAAESLDALLRLAPDLARSPDVMILRSRILLATDRAREALEHAQQVLAETREPELSANARILLGDIHIALDEPEEALKYFSSASLLYDDPAITPEALRKSASTARVLGRTAEATKFERELRQRYPQN